MSGVGDPFTPSFRMSFWQRNGWPENPCRTLLLIPFPLFLHVLRIFEAFLTIHLQTFKPPFADDFQLCSWDHPSWNMEASICRWFSPSNLHEFQLGSASLDAEVPAQRCLQYLCLLPEDPTWISGSKIYVGGMEWMKEHHQTSNIINIACRNRNWKKLCLEVFFEIMELLVVAFLGAFANAWKQRLGALNLVTLWMEIDQWVGRCVK